MFVYKLSGCGFESSCSHLNFTKTKFTHSPLSKVFEKQIKTTEDQGIRQVEALKALKPEKNKDIKSIDGLFPKDMRTKEIKNKIDEIRKWEEKIKQKDLRYERKKYIYDFQQYETITSFGDKIYSGKINIDEGEMDQRNLFKNLEEFSEKSRPKTAGGKSNKRNTFESVNALYEGRELILNAFKNGFFQ